MCDHVQLWHLTITYGKMWESYTLLYIRVVLSTTTKYDMNTNRMSTTQQSKTNTNNGGRWPDVKENLS